MTNVNTKSWVAQLRAAATQVAEQAEEIVGNLDMNVNLKVTISLRTDSETIGWPRLEICREIVPVEAVNEKIRVANEARRGGITQ